MMGEEIFVSLSEGACWFASRGCRSAAAKASSPESELLRIDGVPRSLGAVACSRPEGVAAAAIMPPFAQESSQSSTSTPAAEVKVEQKQKRSRLPKSPSPSSTSESFKQRVPPALKKGTRGGTRSCVSDMCDTLDLEPPQFARANEDIVSAELCALTAAELSSLTLDELCSLMPRSHSVCSRCSDSECSSSGDASTSASASEPPVEDFGSGQVARLDSIAVGGPCLYFAEAISRIGRNGRDWWREAARAVRLAFSAGECPSSDVRLSNRSLNREMGPCGGETDSFVSDGWGAFTGTMAVT